MGGSNARVRVETGSADCEFPRRHEAPFLCVDRSHHGGERAAAEAKWADSHRGHGLGLPKQAAQGL